MATAAQLVARRLYEAGCRHAFGIPGGEVLTVMEALQEAGLEFVLVKHENSGGFMAEGTFHVTGAPGVLLATVGPGVANAVNFIVNAEQDRVPLIYLTGCVDPAEAQTYNHQVFDHTALIGSVAKASFTLVDGAVDTIIDKAVSVAMDGRPGPVHIDISTALAGREQPEEPPTRRVRPAPTAPAPGPDLDFARNLLGNTERPILIAGVEVLVELVLFVLDEVHHGARGVPGEPGANLDGHDRKLLLEARSKVKAPGAAAGDDGDEVVRAGKVAPWRLVAGGGTHLKDAHQAVTELTVVALVAEHLEAEAGDHIP